MKEGGQKVQTSSYKISKSWDVTYSMVTTVTTAVHGTGKLLREQILRVLITRREKKLVFLHLYEMSNIHHPNMIIISKPFKSNHYAAHLRLIQGRVSVTSQ